MIRHGNERVLRARFNDARFFWEFDQRVPLVERVEMLKNVTFQKELGSYPAKSERVQAMAAGLAAGRGARSWAGCCALADAALLAKTDLTTELVKEFTELQGMVGGLYARRRASCGGHAIYDQYKPASMEDSIPRSVEGALLALRIRRHHRGDVWSRAGAYRIKDPFALRRAANGIVKILAESVRCH